MKLRTIMNQSITNKTVLLRLDLNVPLKHGSQDIIILDKTRILRSKQTVDYLLSIGAKKIIIATHLGRPTGIDKAFSTQILLKELESIYNQKIMLCDDYSKAADLHSKIVLLENLRFYKEEEKNCIHFSKLLASLADVYVNDAFSCAHREHSSIVGITNHLPSYAGLLMQEEISALTKALIAPKQPCVAILGGKKVSDKMPILSYIIQKVDHLCIMGAMANTFLKAKGLEIGRSLYEPTLIDFAKDFLTKHKDKILLPLDFIAQDATNAMVLEKISKDDIIFDIGPNTCIAISSILDKANTVLCNGPVGMYEDARYRNSSEFVIRLIASQKARGLFSIAGGGDIVAVIESIGLSSQFGFISTAGGAFLEFIEGKTLPGIKPLLE